MAEAEQTKTSGVVTPPKEQRFGKSVVRWWEGAPGEVVIMAHGGTCDDRTLAEQLVAFDLANCGYKRMAFSFDMPRELRKQASWDDIMAKAIRLIRSGNVHLLRNGFHNIVGHVIGDHGEYNSEIGRDDPNSRAITTWQCECPWDQYAWQRTRKWKKYEGRPCAHVLALYWKSRMTPIDEDYDPGMGPQEPGQKQPEPVPAPATDDAGNPIGPGAGGDEQAQAPAPPPQSMGSPPPGAGPMAPPAPSGVLPQSPMEQLQMMQPPIPGATPNGLPAPPNSVSVPGARLPTPFNPIQYPGGTYSRRVVMPTPEHFGNDWPDGVGCQSWAEAVNELNPHLRLAYGITKAPGSGEGGDHAWNVTPDGKIVDGFYTAHPYFNVDESQLEYHEDPENAFEGHYAHKASDPPNYHVQKDPGIKRCATCTMFDKGKCWGYGNRPVSENGVCESYYRDKRVSRSPFGITVHAADFTNGQRVKAKDELYGITEGREGATDAGQYVAVPAGERGEVIGQDETTGWVEVIFPLSGGPMTSYHVRCFCEPSQLQPLQGGSPFIQRRN